ncbi:22048_t:CDS:2 [Gigaspora margarita]|uniref:22048_t:CDS:1 n=1 Tax=Gigaspora margarita TaxID=4874 RepID=A0ABN7V4C3_GIGMA|nr:22048_t:CDS:2 [Gigaspora margarita]
MNSNLTSYFKSKKKFTLDIIDELEKEIQFKYNKIESTSWPTVSAVEHFSSFSVSKGREVDIHIEIDSTPFIILCKDWTRDIAGLKK